MDGVIGSGLAGEYARISSLFRLLAVKDYCDCDVEDRDSSLGGAPGFDPGRPTGHCCWIYARSFSCSLSDL